MTKQEVEEYAQDAAIYYESTHNSIPSQFEKYLRKAVEFGYETAMNEQGYRISSAYDEGFALGRDKTKIEMAEQYANQSCFTEMANPSLSESIDISDDIKQAFLAGLKAGKPKWHKVADGDYPPCEKDNYTISVLTDKGDTAYYSYNYDCWMSELSGSKINTPIAWCEIPEYTEE